MEPSKPAGAGPGSDGGAAGPSGAPYTPIVATLGYVISPVGQRVLMIRRDSRPGDLHFGKYNGLGGKLGRDEDIVAGMRREIREEAGIEALRLQLAGTISWPGFGEDGEDWFGFIFRIDRYAGQVRERCAEGTLLWVPQDELHALPLWEGDRHFLRLVFAEPLRTFHGVMPYRAGRPLSWQYTLL